MERQGPRSLLSTFPQFRRILAIFAFFLPSALTLIDPLSDALSIAGKGLYVAMLAAALIPAGALLTSSFSRWLQFALTIGVWALLFVQILLLGLYSVCIDGLVGTQ